MPLKRISFVLVSLVLVCLTTSVTFAEDYIEMPFEYFYGRWAEGLQVDNYLQIQKHEDPKYAASVAYMRPKYRINIIYYTHYMIPNWKNQYKLIYGIAYLRPLENWQIGIDKVYYKRHSDDMYPQPYDLQRKYGYDRAFNLEISSHFTNKHNIPINKEDEAFNYYVAPMYRKGSIQFDSEIKVFDNYREREHAEFPNISDEQYYEYGINNDESNLLFSSTLNSSIFDNIQFTGEFIYNVDKEYQSVTRRYIVDTYYLHYREGHQKEYNAYYQTNIRFSNLYLFDLDIYFNQYNIKSSEDEYGFDYVDQDTSFFHEEKIDHKFMNEFTTFGLNLVYLSDGDFENGIILDDYNNFYHNMLFKNQVLTKLNFNYRLSELYATERDVRIIYNFAYGLTEYLQFSLNFYYEWQKAIDNHYSFYGEKIYQQYKLSFRSYKYKPGVSPGWYDDDQMDIMYGRIKELGQVYFELIFTPPSQGSSSDAKRSIFSFDNLRNSHSSNINTRLICGLGQGFMLEIQDQEVYRSSSFEERLYTFILIKRIKDFFQFNMRFTDKYFKTYSSTSYHDPIINLEFNLFL